MTKENIGSRSIPVALLYLLTACAGDAAPQDAGAVSVSARLGEKSYSSAGAGHCRHAPTASIYNVPAALWMAELAGSEDAAITGVNLTLWRPKDGGREQLSLSVRTRSSSHRINVGGRGDQVGSGTVSFSPAGAGGRFEVKGKDEKGTALEVVIKCAAFDGVEAEGG